MNMKEREEVRENKKERNKRGGGGMDVYYMQRDDRDML